MDSASKKSVLVPQTAVSRMESLFSQLKTMVRDTLTTVRDTLTTVRGTLTTVRGTLTTVRGTLTTVRGTQKLNIAMAKPLECGSFAAALQGVLRTRSWYPGMFLLNSFTIDSIV
jgi:hypothetical protein